MKKKLPYLCPSCDTELSVQSLVCSSCETIVSGKFSLPILSQLNDEDQSFVLDFILCSGSLKVMAEKLKLSYPSVRNKLDDLIEHLNTLRKSEK